jgi:hypothetical protein
MKLVVTIDVEEEGLFSSRYDPHNPTVENVPALTRLDQYSECGVFDLLCSARIRW